MAFRGRSDTSRRRFFRRGQSRTIPRWTAQTTDLTLTAGTAGAIILVDQDFLSTLGSAILERESKVVRLVGHVSVRTLAAGATGGSVGLGLVKTQNPSVTLGGINDPLIVAQLALRDWMRVMNLDYPANAGANGWMLRQEFDVRVQRRLKSPDYIILAASNLAGGDTVIITIDVRILIVIRA